MPLERASPGPSERQCRLTSRSTTAWRDKEGLPVEFSVWAPDRQRVRVAVDGAVHEMKRGDDGWWRARAAGQDYAFLVDDDPTILPDPRSRWQPKGVHAPSRVFDPIGYRWHDTGWKGRQLAGCVLYELHVGTFTVDGTLDSALERLDQLVDLGIDFVELLPVNAVDGPRSWGYDGAAWFAVTENYGGPAALMRFVDAAHQRGLGVILDVVYNHFGPSGAYLDRFAPYFAGSTEWGPALNLDGQESDEVRRYIVDNALMWLRDFHIDGLRLDAVHQLHDVHALHILEHLAMEVETLSAHLGHPLTLIAESNLNDSRIVTSRSGGGYGLDAQWCDDIHNALHATLTGESDGYYSDFAAAGIIGLAQTLTKGYHYADTWSSYRRRTHGAPFDAWRIPGYRLVAYLQNHDQIGNRAAGDRLSATLSPEMLACAAALLLCSPFTPMLFMGEEWGAKTPWKFFSRLSDERLRESVRRGRLQKLRKYGWAEDAISDPNDEAAFTESVLDWTELNRERHGWLLGIYRDLIALRRKNVELTDPWLGRLGVNIDEYARIVIMIRGDVRVVVNLGDVDAGCDLAGTVGSMLLASGDASVHGKQLTVQARSFAIVRMTSYMQSGQTGSGTPLDSLQV